MLKIVTYRSIKNKFRALPPRCPPSRRLKKKKFNADDQYKRVIDTKIPKIFKL